MTSIRLTQEIPLRGSYDVVVCGGGVAGVGAALSARRAGKRVLLLEKSLFLGGLATLGLINFFVPMCNGRGRQIVTGLAEELLRLSIRYGYDTLPAEWASGEPGPGAKTRYVTRFSANIFALTLMEQLLDEGVELLLDTVVSSPLMEGGRCRGLVVENKTGRGFYEAGMVVDATGDADVLARAGVPTVLGQNFFTYTAAGITLDSCRRAAESGRIQDALVNFSGGKATLYGQNQPVDEKLYAGVTAEEVSQYVTRNQRLLLQSLKAQDRTAREVVTLPGMAQLRTTRRIAGDYALTTADQYRHFEDSVGAICDFDNRDFLYEVPLRTLCMDGFDNLLTAGRSAAATGYAWDVLRVIPPAILTGQAAGTAAAQALDENKPVSRLNIGRLQASLAAQGVLVHFPDELVPAKEAPQGERFDTGHI